MLDDVVRPEEVMDLLPCDERGQPVGHVLLSTQSQGSWPREARVSERYPIGPLSTEQSLELLGKDKSVKKEVLEDDEINLRRYVEEELGNLAIGVAL